MCPYLEIYEKGNIIKGRTITRDCGLK